MRQEPTVETYVNIYHFDFDYCTDAVVPHDEFDEPMSGFYYEIVDAKGRIIVPLFGPYGSNTEVHKACRREHRRLARL